MGSWPYYEAKCDSLNTRTDSPAIITATATATTTTTTATTTTTTTTMETRMDTKTEMKMALTKVSSSTYLSNSFDAFFLGNSGGNASLRALQ